jgi:hypothetical protein
VSEYDAQTNESQVESFSISQFDRPRAFVLDDDPSMERDKFHLSTAMYRQAMYRYAKFRFHLSWPYIDMPRI